MSVHKVWFFVIPAEAGIQNLLKTLDSGLRTAGMTYKLNASLYTNSDYSDISGSFKLTMYDIYAIYYLKYIL